jgi:hypothetical protein
MNGHRKRANNKKDKRSKNNYKNLPQIFNAKEKGVN